MIEFQVTKKSTKSRARLGVLRTPHGEIETPAFIPVATQATLKTLDPKEILEAGSQMLISNTYHLNLKPGADIVADAGGIHEFSGIDMPFMTDSAGFQVFSLGFGKDQKVGKILKYFPEPQGHELIAPSPQPKDVTITPEGAHFRSPLDGSELFIGPKESIELQQKIGADIILTFDECTSPLSTMKYIEESLERTHAWAKKCIEVKTSDQALFGIVQGSHYENLREKASKFIDSLPFDGYAIGGDLGTSKKDMENILQWTIPNLDDNKPRHLLGVGHLEDMELIIKEGVDTFDCTVPTHYGRHGTAFTSEGRLNFHQSKHLKDHGVLDAKCDCKVCKSGTKRSYLSHLIRSGELLGLRYLTYHNLHHFHSYVESIREKIKNNTL